MSTNARQNRFPCAGARALHAPTRRDFVYGIGASVGSIALTSMLAAETKSENSSKAGPMIPKAGHFPAKAKNCIFLMMEGGPSHIDTFDPKPTLSKLHLKEFVREGEMKSAMESGKRYYVQSPFKFIKAGQSGVDMAENWSSLAKVADHLCFYRGCKVDSVNHPTAMYQMNCGNRFGGDPAIGAWTTYGLGSINQDLPGFVVLPRLVIRKAGRPIGATVTCPHFIKEHPFARPALQFSIYNRRPTLRRSDNEPTWNCCRSSMPSTLPNIHNTLIFRLAWQVTNWPFACRRKFRKCST